MEIKSKAILLLLLMALMMVVGSNTWAQEGKDTFIFKDAEGSWAAREIKYLTFRGIIKGQEDGNFHPRASITRAEFVKLLVKALGLAGTSQANPVFKDVQPQEWYYSYIGLAAGAGLVRGTEDNFWPEKFISREEAAVILVRAVGQEQEAQKMAPAIIHTLLINYPDREGISPWADEYMALALREHLFTGQPGSALEPLAQLTREEAAALTVRLMLKLKLIPD